MRIAVSADGPDLESHASPIFGRCPTFVLVDTDTLALESHNNPAQNYGEGAGIAAAEFVVAKGAEAVLTGNVGANALRVLNAAQVLVYRIKRGTVGQAVQSLADGKLVATRSANVARYAGLGAPTAPDALARSDEMAEIRDEIARLRRSIDALRARLEDLEKET